MSSTTGDVRWGTWTFYKSASRGTYWAERAAFVHKDFRGPSDLQFVSVDIDEVLHRKGCPTGNLPVGLIYRCPKCGEQLPPDKLTREDVVNWWIKMCIVHVGCFPPKEPPCPVKRFDEYDSQGNRYYILAKKERWVLEDSAVAIAFQYAVERHLIMVGEDDYVVNCGEVHESRHRSVAAAVKALYHETFADLEVGDG